MSRDVYYSVGGKKIWNAVDARRQAQKTGTELQFHSYDDCYDRVDWTKEPSGDWNTWCAQRATQLREKYQHLSLLFSAGSDSSDILRIFLENNIRLDELIIFKHPYNSIRKHEADTMIIPMARVYQKICPSLKVTVHEIRQDLYERWYSDEQWLTAQGSMSGQMNMGACNYALLTDYFCNNNQKNQHGFIMGLEKPKLLIEDGWWTSRILDRIWEYMTLSDNNIDQFYLSPDWPEFFVKQCWQFVRYMERNFEHTDMTLLNNIYKQGGEHSHHYLAASGRRIYGDMSSPMFIRNGANKIKDLTDRGVVDLHTAAQSQQWRCYSEWQGMVQHLQQTESYLFRHNDYQQGLTLAWAKPYRIKPVDGDN